jgi:hypothetical protein
LIERALSVFAAAVAVWSGWVDYPALGLVIVAALSGWVAEPVTAAFASAHQPDYSWGAAWSHRVALVD